MMTPPVLKAVHITKTFRDRTGKVIPVLREVSLQVRGGEFATVQGASGCGKSTLLLILGGLLQPNSGTVRLSGDPVGAWRQPGSSNLQPGRIGFVFQRFHLLPYLTVEENIRAAWIAAPGDPPSHRTQELIDKFDLTHRAGHLPGQISVGEQQRTALARAFATAPALILADEPTGNLDPANADIVLGALGQFAANGGAVLMVTHHPDSAATAHTRWILRDGQCEQFNNPLHNQTIKTESSPASGKETGSPE